MVRPGRLAESSSLICDDTGSVWFDDSERIATPRSAIARRASLERKCSASSGRRSRFTSTSFRAWRCAMARTSHVLPTCLAPRNTRGLRSAAESHASRKADISRFTLSSLLSIHNDDRDGAVLFLTCQQQQVVLARICKTLSVQNIKTQAP